MTVDIELIIDKVDFWILITPFDAEIDFRNSSEENLEYTTTSTPVFSLKQLLLLKKDCYIANMTSKGESLSIVELLETHPQSRFAVYPESMDKIPRISYERRIVNTVARQLHKALRKRL